MIELVARKVSSGDIYISKSRAHLDKNEWGMAYLSLQQALKKGNLSEEDKAIGLYREICMCLNLAPRLDIAARDTQSDLQI